MNQPATTSGNPIYYRLIALWVLCEAMLGGIIHAVRIPVSGLIIGGCAVVCICLIAFYVPAKGAIIKATIMVAIFKMMLSPQSPPLAYFAVFFQGLMGELLFWNRNFYRVSCLLLGLIALLESGLQRILVLTIVYGSNFWKAINDFINELTRQKNFTNYSLLVAGGYVALHIIAGILIGWWAGLIPKKRMIWENREKQNEDETASKEKSIPIRKKRKNWLKKGALITWICLILVYCQSYFKIGNPILPSDLPLQIFIRSVIIILGWYFAIGPLISYLLKVWLQKNQLRSKEEIQRIVQLLPDIQELITTSWQKTKRKRGIKRMIHFAENVLIKILEKNNA
ncbi:MAG: hypothetical protein ACHQEB_00085 [Chitinophagales bacterium]